MTVLSGGHASGRARRLRQTFRRLWDRPAHGAELQLVCFGQSHANTLRNAWWRGLYQPEQPGLHVQFLLRGRKKFPSDAIVSRSPETGEDAVHAGLARELERHARRTNGSSETWLLSVVRGNDYNVFGLFEPDPPFDFVHPALPDLPLRTDVPLVPYDAIRLRFQAAAQATRRFYRCLPRRDAAGVLHLEAPPPIPSEEQCRRSIELVLLKHALGRGRGVRISPREFRMKLWKCQSDASREVCRETDVIYVGPPEDALDHEGYLLPQAWLGATHASSWYGVLALKKIEALIAERRRSR